MIEIDTLPVHNHEQGREGTHDLVSGARQAEMSFSDPVIARVYQMALEAFEGLNVQLWLFGSHARGDARPSSDIDLAFLPLETLPASLISDLGEAFEESTIPCRVDLVDLRYASTSLKGEVEREGIPWIA